MPQLFAQFKQTETHLSAFEHTPHSSSGKSGTFRLHISTHPQKSSRKIFVSFIYANNMKVSDK